MEEKYRKLAVDLGIKMENDDSCVMPTSKLNGLERENEELKEKIKLLTDVIISQRKRINWLEETKTDLENFLDDTKLDVSELREEIEILEKIIDKCNTTYPNAKVQTVYDNHTVTCEPSKGAKWRKIEDGND